MSDMTKFDNYDPKVWQDGFDTGRNASMSDLLQALRIARQQIVTLGGDLSGLTTKEEAQECSVDMIQWEVLQVIDEALANGGI